MNTTFFRLRSFAALAVLLSFVMLFSNCRKEKFITDSGAQLSFSTDTLTFDTVFTTIGSTTKFIRIYNTHKQSIKISDIRLGGGSSSQFRINVDGIPGAVATDMEILPEDSIYIFVEVTVDPGNQDLPFVMIDSIEFETNGNHQRVVLEAWGQDAHFFRSEAICTQTWPNDKPYVIINFLELDSGCVLTIDPGVRIYFGGGAGMFINGTSQIIANGTKEDPVVFQGIRLESFFDDLPGQWLGIFILRGSNGNSLTHTHIKNSDYGVSMGSSRDSEITASTFTFANAPDVVLDKCIIQNSFLNCVFGFLSVVTANNCLFFNAGEYMATLGLGGVYEFNHCTFANFGSNTISHQNPIILMSNLAETSQNLFLADLQATFTNSIIYGSLESEIELSQADDTLGVLFDFTFDHCLMKLDEEDFNLADTTYINVINNQDPLFLDVSEDDYHLSAGSPAIDSGATTTGLTVGLDEEMREASAPDIGAYEYVE